MIKTKLISFENENGFILFSLLEELPFVVIFNENFTMARFTFGWQREQPLKNITVFNHGFYSLFCR